MNVGLRAGFSLGRADWSWTLNDLERQSDTTNMRVNKLHVASKIDHRFLSSAAEAKINVLHTALYMRAHQLFTGLMVAWLLPPPPL
jgi:hypothetical protein